MNTAQPVVLVVDDDPSVRKALARLIRFAGIAVETFALAEEVLERLAKPITGCILADLQMPGLNGLQLQTELTRRQICTPIIFISGQGDVPSSVDAMKAGAVDFLIKPFQRHAVLAAIKLALEKDARERIRLEQREEARRLARSLTPREAEVFRMVVAGRPNKQIAIELGTTESTVKVHRGRIMSKMQADSLAALVRLSDLVGNEF